MKTLLTLVALVLSGCASQSLRMPAAWQTPVPRTPRIETVGIGGNGKLLYYSERVGMQCTLRVGPIAGGPAGQTVPLTFCPDRIVTLSDASILLQNREGASLLLDEQGNAVAGHGSPLVRRAAEQSILAAASKDVRLERSAGGRLERVDGASRRPLDLTCLSDARFRPATKSVAGITCGSEAKLVIEDLTGPVKTLTPAYPAIDSFAFSPDGNEIVFSVRRDAGFDVALVSSDGSDVHWVPSVPGDETHVSYAPRGHKIAFFLRAGDATLIRSVHVPTATQVTAEFPFATVRDLAWLPEGDKYAAVVSSVDRSDHIELLRYDGSDRTQLTASVARLTQELEPAAGGLLLIRPQNLRYNERVPLVIWADEASPFTWDDDRAWLHAAARTGSAVTAKSVAQLDDAFWKSIRALSWIDPDRIYVVSAGPLPAKLAVAGGETPLPVTYIAPADSRTDLPPDRYLQRIVGASRAILLRPGQPGSVKSSAATLIADQLKGPVPQNDHR